jgi:hypothetical protein
MLQAVFQMHLDKHVTDTVGCSEKYELNTETRNGQDGAGVFLCTWYEQAFSHRDHLDVEIHTFSIRFMPILFSKS